MAIEQLTAQLETTFVALLKGIHQTDNNGGNSNNNIEGLETHKIIISIIESSSKIYKLKKYEKAINNPIHGKQ